MSCRAVPGSRLVASALVLASCGSPGAIRVAGAEAPAAVVAAAPRDTPALAGPAVEGGEFVFTVRGRPAGGERFAIARVDDGYRITSEVRLESGARLRLIESELSVDEAWRPRTAIIRDVRDGGTEASLEGAPLVLTTRNREGSTVRTASRPVDLYVADYTLSHYWPLCARPAGVATVFPGAELRLSPGLATAAPGVERRTADLAGALRVVIACAGSRLLAVEIPALGLVAVRPEHAAEVAAAAPVPAPPAIAPAWLEVEDRVVEAPATTGAGAARLACTLTRPRGRARAPVALLLNGSGAQDRDGDTVGPGGVKLGLLRSVAEALAASGVASLRCDDRSVGDSIGDFGAATVDTFVADARALIAALRRDRAVDGRRLTVVGHSEGAVVATLCAAGDRAIARVALLAGPGRPVDQVLLDQVARTVARSGLTEAEGAAAMVRYRAVFAAIATGAPVPDTVEGDEWNGAAGWIRSHLAHDVGAALARVAPRPVFIAQGLIDQQVDVRDAAALAAAARRRAGAVVIERRYPGVDHLFARSDTGDPAEYMEPGRVVDPEFLADLARFVAEP